MDEMAREYEAYMNSKTETVDMSEHSLVDVYEAVKKATGGKFCFTMKPRED